MSMSKSRSGAVRQQIDVIIDADMFDAPCRVGTLFFAPGHGGGVYSFRYDNAWLSRPDAFAIDADLDLHNSEAYPSDESGVFRIFLDSAPDRWGRVLLDRREILRAKDAQRAPRHLTEWDYLLGVHDSCRLGALRFRKDDNSNFLDDDAQLSAPPLATLRELEAASFALEDPHATDNPRFREWLTALLAPGSSLGGARPKANFIDVDGRLWIAKFPSRNDRRNIGAWEMVVHILAQKAGVEVPPAKLLKLAGEHHTFACERFDRNAKARRRFFVSAMTLLGKRDGEGGSYLDLAEFLSTRGSARDKKADLQQLWTRVIFNILVSNTDDHLRNHGFILNSDGWRLAPAYDMNANTEKAGHTLAIDERDTSPDIDVALSTAEYYQLPLPTAREIVKKVQAVVATWTREAEKLGLTQSEISQMAAAFRS